MPVWEDYYRVLQVHYLAEPEVIESAYKRLAKKYHPDLNKSAGADARMKKINEAYDTLKDAGKRKAYDDERLKRPSVSSYEQPYDRTPPKKDADDDDSSPAKEALTSYFESIKNRDFEHAYELITAKDKSNISPDDFVKWQSGVSRIYSLQDYSCKTDKSASNVTLFGQTYQCVVEFSVKTTEHNTVMGRLEKDTLNKKVVYEDGAWRVIVGCDDIKPYISKFEELGGLLAAKSAINDMVELYSSTDNMSGLLNRKGFSDVAQREIWRYERYGNIFSLMLLDISCGTEGLRAKQEFMSASAAWAGIILKEGFRKLDILGRWSDSRYMVLLPEIDLRNGIMAARKIRKIFESNKLIYNKRAYKATVNIGVEEFKGSFESAVRNLAKYLTAAEKTKGSSIISCYGAYQA
jgi:diguanylate cyclase (GGDEF)-like protein